MNAVGYLLLAAGFVGAAYVASLSPTKVDWLLFTPAFLTGVAGVVTIRGARRAAARHSTLLQQNLEILDRSLRNIVENLDAFRKGAAEIPGHELRFEIDRRFREDLRDFADARQSMTILFGMRAYGEVMSAFAAGERYINRIWSASADDYEEEARAYIEYAHAQFGEARAAFDKARQAASRAPA